MRFKKKTIVIIGLILILIIGGYFWKKQKQSIIKAQEEKNMMHEVQTGDIEVNVKVTSTAKLANEQNLSFAREGKIINVNVKVGDEIKAGDILAQIDMDDYENAIKTSKLELDNAILGLEKLLYDDTSLREAQIKSQINETKSNYNLEIEQEQVLKKQLDIIFKQKKDQLEQLVRDYKLTKKNVEIAASGLDVGIQIETEQTHDTLTTHKQTINSIISSLKSSLGDAEFVVESVDRIFGITDTFEENDDTYSELLSVKETRLKQNIETQIKDLYILINKYSELINNINENSSDEEIYELIQNFYNESESLIVLCDTALDAIDMSIESVNLSETMLQGFITNISTARSSAISMRSGLQTLASSVNSLLSYSSQENSLKVSIDQKQLEYDKLKVSLQNKQENIKLVADELETLKKDHKNQLNRKSKQISLLSEKIDVLEKELQDVIDGPDEYDIERQKNLIGQAELKLERTRDQKDDYQIIAEFDGRVRSIDIVEGEQYELDDRKFIVVENPNLIELELQVSQIDIVKIKQGDPVVVTFDAYPNKPIEANITSRNVNPEPNGRGGVYYKATILLEKQELEILAGMSALVTIKTAEAKNVISIPTLALIQNGDKNFVYIKEGNEYKLHEVEIGIMNNFQVEVVSGLNAGDIIKGSVLDEEALIEMGIDDSSNSPFGG